MLNYGKLGTMFGKMRKHMHLEVESFDSDNAKLLNLYFTLDVIQSDISFKEGGCQIHSPIKSTVSLDRELNLKIINN